MKYHLGADGIFQAETGETIKISLAANPSHLEAVDPVVEGIVRAKQDLLNRGTEFPVLPILVHGDAAFAGQGVVAETLNLSQLRGYRTGGTVHVVVNNQVGFTTSPAASRSSLYSTDVARMIQAPIFHVNGDDPEACARVARLAFEFRQAFNKDVVIDLICYRKRGHNEGDDPSMTQPLMYDLIEQKRSVRKLYTEALVGRGDISIEDAELAMRDFQETLESAFSEVREATSHRAHPTVPAYPSKPTLADTRTAVELEVLKRVAEVHLSFPEGFTVHPKVLPQLQRRAGMLSEGGLDWATAEILAFGSLLLEKRAVRLSGQDSRRGTFVQRFAVVVDRKTGDEYVPLAHLSPDQGAFHVYDSLLSEYAVVGFEYGYSVARPEALVVWEAQFGDFVNGAQSIIDEFISSGEAKWGQRSGVVLLLPHGLRGSRTGPLVRPDRAVPPALCGRLDDRGPTVDAGEPLPPAASSGAAVRPPSTCRVHAEVDAAAQGGGVADRGLHERLVQDDHPRSCVGRGPGRPAGHPLLGQDQLAAARRAREARGRRRRDRSGRAALPRRHQRDPRGARGVPGHRRGGLDPGRAREPRRMVVDRPHPRSCAG